MAKGTTILMTFNGFQGAAATAIMLEKFPGAEIVPSSARRIANALMTLKLTGGEAIYIVGLGFFCPQEEIVAALERVLKAKSSVTWIHYKGDITGVEEALKRYRNFRVIDISGKNLPASVAREFGCTSKETKGLVTLARQEEKDSLDEKVHNDLRCRLIEAAILKYLKFEDTDAYPEAIRKLRTPSLITEFDIK